MTTSTAWSVHSVLIWVSDLDTSLQFYADVCDLQVIVHEPNAAILSDISGSPALLLRQADRGGIHSGQQTLGMRACAFNVGSSNELDRVEARLIARNAYQDRQRQGENGRVGLVRGHDPDRLPLGFMNYEPPLSAAESRSLLPLIYGWDV
jgi:catechol-2,3-dioxygenase